MKRNKNICFCIFLMILSNQHLYAHDPEGWKNLTYSFVVIVSLLFSVATSIGIFNTLFKEINKNYLWAGILGSIISESIFIKIFLLLINIIFDLIDDTFVSISLFFFCLFIFSGIGSYVGIKLTHKFYSKKFKEN